MTPQEKFSVLFLCTGNSCRSQMAEGLVNALRSHQWRAFSAGSTPAGYVHPLSMTVMQDLGIDISQHHSKSVEVYRQQPFDLVVTVCDSAAENCPIWLGQGRKGHLGFVDPAHAQGSESERLALFREVRDQIRHVVLNYLDQIIPTLWDAASAERVKGTEHAT